MVNIVGLRIGIAGMKSQEITKSQDNVCLGKYRLSWINIATKLLVDLITTNTSKVVALRIEEETLEQRTSGVYSWRLTRTLATINLDKCIFAGLSSITLKGGANDLRIAEKSNDFVIRFCNAKCTKQQRGRLTTLTIDRNNKLAAFIDLKFKPCTT